MLNFLKISEIVFLFVTEVFVKPDSFLEGQLSKTPKVNYFLQHIFESVSLNIQQTYLFHNLLRIPHLDIQVKVVVTQRTIRYFTADFELRQAWLELSEYSVSLVLKEGLPAVKRAIQDKSFGVMMQESEGVHCELTIKLILPLFLSNFPVVSKIVIHVY